MGFVGFGGSELQEVNLSVQGVCIGRILNVVMRCSSLRAICKSVKQT